MGIRRNKVLYNATAAGTGAWVRLDSRYEEIAERSIQGFMTSGDTVTVQGTSVDLHGYIGDLTQTLNPEDIATLGTYTASFVDTLVGNWTYIRVIKTGTAGLAKVQG